LRDIRSIRITTGKVPLPNQGDIDGPKVVQAAAPDKTPANTVADAGAPKRALNEPGMLGSVVTTGATETAQLLDPKSGNATPPPRYEFSAPVMANTDNNPANSSATNGSPVNNSAVNGGPTNNGSANNSPFNNPANSNPAANNSPAERSSGPSSLNEAANPKNGFWTNGSPLSQGQPTPASVPTDTKAPADANKSATPYRDPSLVDTFSDNRYTAAAPAIGANELTANKQEVSAPEAKPWMPLMLALLALFASLAANVYLVWLHQEIRFKYFSLLRRLPDGSVSTV